MQIRGKEKKKIGNGLMQRMKDIVGDWNRLV